MNRFLIVLNIIFLNSALVSGQVAEFSCKKSVFKFEKVVAGEVVTHDFEFVNTGDAPLIITDYAVACKCTKVIFPKEPIPPGGKGIVTVTFDTEGKYLYQDRTITLLVNTKKKIAKLRFKIYVEPKQ
jgi:hypothetical protein